MKDYKDIGDDQIRIIGCNPSTRKQKFSGFKVLIIIFLAIGLVIMAVIVFIMGNTGGISSTMQDTPEKDVVQVELKEDTTRVPVSSFTEIRDTAVFNIPLRIYIPHHAELTLHIGKMDLQDKSVIYVAQAADIRADNGGIVGAFVLKGEPRAWGQSKKGFCASIGGKVTVGVAKNTSLFEQATEEEGYFFRQYPLVHKGQVIQDNPKGKSIRRGLCYSKGQVFMVESLNRITFHDFSNSLVALGVDEAIYLVGSSSYGWAIDRNNNRHEFGDDSYYSGRSVMPENISYIVWRKYGDETIR